MHWTSAAALDPDVDALLPVLLDRVEEGLARGGDGEGCDLVFLFVGAEHARHVVKIQARVLDRLGGPHLLGCSADGVIGGRREYERAPAVSILAGRLPGADVHLFHLDNPNLPDADSAPRAWHEAVGVSPADRPSFVVVPDPWSHLADAVLAGLDFAWPGSVTVGGVASGSRRPNVEALLLDEWIYRSGAVGAALMGDVRVEAAVAQGCRPIGPALTVSGCEEHLLTGLDGRAPLDALRDSIEAQEGPREEMANRVFLLGFEMDPFEADDEGPWLVRPLIGVDRKTRGLVVAERLRPGRRVRFHLRDRETSREDLARTLDAVDRSSSPAGALLFSCMGRGVNLYGSPGHDSRVFEDQFAGVPLAGFFCNGEIGPVGGSTHLHGFTSAFGLIRPAAGA